MLLVLQIAGGIILAVLALTCWPLALITLLGGILIYTAAVYVLPILPIIFAYIVSGFLTVLPIIGFLVAMVLVLSLPHTVITNWSSIKHEFSQALVQLCKSFLRFIIWITVAGLTATLFVYLLILSPYAANEGLIFLSICLLPCIIATFVTHRFTRHFLNKSNSPQPISQFYKWISLMGIAVFIILTVGHISEILPPVIVIGSIIVLHSLNKSFK